MIELTSNLVVIADEYQYIVGKPRHSTDKSGQPAIRVDRPTYHTTLASVLKAAVAQALRDGVAEGTITTLRGYLDEQQHLQDDFAKLLEPLE
jgi:hypothetical protein